jgi:hypothetical protein
MKNNCSKPTKWRRRHTTSRLKHYRLQGIKNIYGFKNSIRISEETQRFSITGVSRLMQFKEIIAVYSENRTKHTNTNRSYWV